VPAAGHTRRAMMLRAGAALALAGALRSSMARAAAGDPFTIVIVETTGELPGFKNTELPAYVAQQMSAADLDGWRFRRRPVAAMELIDWVEWRFRWNPYAGGDVRRFIPIPSVSRTFGARYLISAELRLYLRGEYETMTFGQATVQGGPNDSELAAFIAKLSRSLFAAYALLSGNSAGGAPSVTARH